MSSAKSRWLRAILRTRSVDRFRGPVTKRVKRELLMGTAVVGGVAVIVGAVIGLFGAWLTNMQNSKDRKLELLHRARERRADRVEQLYKDVREQVGLMRVANDEKERRNGGHGLHYQWVPEVGDMVRVKPHFEPLEDALESILLIGSPDMGEAARRYVASEYELLGVPKGTDEFELHSAKSLKHLEKLRSASRAEMNIP